LEAERQENDRIRKSLVEAQERNDELFKKVSDSEYRAQQLQDTVQKLVSLFLHIVFFNSTLTTIASLPVNLLYVIIL
jgi:hypothetical protein